METHFNNIRYNLIISGIIPTSNTRTENSAVYWIFGRAKDNYYWQQIKLMDPRPYTYEFRKPRLSNPTYKSDHLYESIYHMGAYGKIYPNLDKISNKEPTPQGFTINPARAERTKQAQPNKLHEEIRKIDPYYQDMKKGWNRQQPQASNNNHIQKNNNKYANEAALHYQPDREPTKIQYLQNRNYEPKVGEQMQAYNFSKQLNNQVERQQNFSQSRSYSQDSKGIRQKQEEPEAGYMSGYGSKLLFTPTPRRGDQDTVFERQQKPYNIINCYPKQVFNTHRAYPKYTLEHKLIETGQYPYIPSNPERIYDNR